MELFPIYLLLFFVSLSVQATLPCAGTPGRLRASAGGGVGSGVPRGAGQGAIALAR